MTLTEPKPEEAAAAADEIAPESLIFSAATSVWPRARLVAIGRRGVQVEVRPAPLGDVAAYTGHLSQMDDASQEADPSVLWPILIIPSVYKPSYDARSRWLPGASAERVFTAHDHDVIRRMDARVAEALFIATVEQSGMLKAEQKAAGWRLINDGFFVGLFVVAEKLSMTVNELCTRMSSFEFGWWLSFLDYRTMMEEMASHRPGGSSGPTETMGGQM